MEKAFLPTHTEASSRTCGLEHPVITLTVPLGKGLHHPVDLLGLSREPEAPQELPKGGDRSTALTCLAAAAAGGGGFNIRGQREVRGLLSTFTETEQKRI